MIISISGTTGFNFGTPEGKELKYNVMLNAAYVGKYYLPATYCEAMYNKSISALQKGEWVEVVKSLSELD
jgi:uncharacterized protein YfaS (alpha-2-macroglobulin family)